MWQETFLWQETTLFDSKYYWKHSEEHTQDISVFNNWQIFHQMTKTKPRGNIHPLLCSFQQLVNHPCYCTIIIVVITYYPNSPARIKLFSTSQLIVSFLTASALKCRPLLLLFSRSLCDDWSLNCQWTNLQNIWRYFAFWRKKAGFWHLTRIRTTFQCNGK